MSTTPDAGGLHPGSPTPESPDEVEALLRQVPEMAFVPEVEACMPAASAIGDAPSLDELRGLATAEYLARVLEALGSVEQRAHAEQNGGLRFLAHALRHFLTVQKLPPGEHPLVVGLYLRAHARKAGRPETVRSIAQAMDDWAPG